MRVAKALEATGVSHVLVGSMSSNVHGFARSTKDMDLVVQTDAAGLDRLFAALGITNGQFSMMVAMGGMTLSAEAVRGQIAAAVGMVVQVMRLSDGKRKVMSITEITGMEGNVVQMQDIFVFNRTRTDPDGTVHGEFRATGLRPKCLDEMIRKGIPYDTANFDPQRAL